MGIIRTVTLAYTAAAANNIAQSQSPGAGVITLNGSLVTAGVATLDAARRVIVTSGGVDTGITFTITGTRANGQPMVETITGASSAAASSTQDFKTVSSVTHTGSVASTVTVGTSGVGSSDWFSIDQNAIVFGPLGISVVVTGTINYTVEYTYDQLMTWNWSGGTFPGVFSISGGALTAKAANGEGGAGFNFPVSAIRLTQNSFTNPGTARMTWVQQGPTS